MSLLTDTDIEHVLCKTKTWEDSNNKLQIYPFHDDSLTPVGYDARVGGKYISGSMPGYRELKKGEKLVLKPGEIALISTIETIGMPKTKTISALICSRVSCVSKGLSHISTTIDANWSGHLLIAITNHAPYRITLEYGNPFCTIVFFRNESAATRDEPSPPDRPDILMEEWKRRTHSARRKSILKLLVPPAVLIGIYLTGYHFFGNSPGLIATTTLGVFLGSYLQK